MGLRPGRTTRKVERPWTRVSRRKPRKSFVVGVPYSRIHVFEMGNERSVQIRDNALESARVVSNKFLERTINPDNYFMKILVYPHHVLREHSLATGAGADRYSTGMSKSFGKPKGRAARVKKDQRLILLKLNKKDLGVGRKALKRADLKLPTPCRIEVK